MSTSRITPEAADPLGTPAYPGLNAQCTELFNRERARLLAALGSTTVGGIIEGIEHIGSTSVPGLSGGGCVDIGLAVWPFPLAPSRQAALEDIGYKLLEADDASIQRFALQYDAVQLFIVVAGGEHWMEYLLVRDYLRHNALARQNWASLTSKALRFEGLLPDAHRWWVKHHGFGPVEAVAEELKALNCRWYISSGWALDLFLGEVTRLHHDVDVIVARADQLTLQRYMIERGWQWLTPFERRVESWPPHMQLALPRHQAHAHRDGAFIDFLLTDIEHGVWRYRRSPSILRSVERMSLSAQNGIPYLAPELVLLFKSKNTSDQERRKDQTDFERVRGHLEPERRAWLRWALMATEPEHRWLRQLGE